MSYDRSTLLTNGEHDELWRNGAKALPDLVHNLGALSKATRAANAVTIARDLYQVGDISKEDYIDTLHGLLIDSGYQVIR